MGPRLLTFVCVLVGLVSTMPPMADAHSRRVARPHHRSHVGHQRKSHRHHARHIAQRTKRAPTWVPTTSKHTSTVTASSVPRPDPVQQPASSSPHLIWSDEFNGSAGTSPDATKWGFDLGGNGWGNNELQSYTSRPSNASLDGQGHLVITARGETYTGSDGVTRGYTSARMQTLHTFQFLYGRMEARIQVPAGTGLLPAFWSLGNDAYSSSGAWPGSGEIDAMEILGSEPSILNGTVHGPWGWTQDGIGGTAQSPTPLSAGFHTYGVQWSPGQITFLLDGFAYETVRQADLPAGAPWPFQHPNFMLLDLAVGGDWPGAPSPSTPMPARMAVDWVRVWQ
jgi:beta-glucanase (GH16 family)